jgi:hypothetical protein
MNGSNVWIVIGRINVPAAMNLLGKIVMKTKFGVYISCRDCYGEDDLGCFDGGREYVGIFDTLDEATKAGNEAHMDCPLWEYEIEELIITKTQIKVERLGSFG